MCVGINIKHAFWPFQKADLSQKSRHNPSPPTWAELKQKFVAWSETGSSQSYLAEVRTEVQGVESDMHLLLHGRSQTISPGGGDGTDPAPTS